MLNCSESLSTFTTKRENDVRYDKDDDGATAAVLQQKYWPPQYHYSVEYHVCDRVSRSYDA